MNIIHYLLYLWLDTFARHHGVSFDMISIFQGYTVAPRAKNIRSTSDFQNYFTISRYGILQPVKGHTFIFVRNMRYRQLKLKTSFVVVEKLYYYTFDRVMFHSVIVHYKLKHKLLCVRFFTTITPYSNTK